MKKLALLISILLLKSSGYSQDFTASTIIPSKLILGISKKANKTSISLDKQTTKYLGQFERQERKLKKQLFKKDSVLAIELFNNIEGKYNQLKQKKSGNSSSVFSSHLDSLSTALRFLNTSTKDNVAIQNTLAQYQELQAHFNHAAEVKKYISERKKLLYTHFEKTGSLKYLRRLQKDAYYYSAQIKECKNVFENSSAFEDKLLQLARRSPKFKDFFAKNSQLGSLFSLPGANNSNASLAGLQTTASINQGLVSRFGNSANVSQQLRSGIQSAQAQLNHLKATNLKSGSGSIGNGEADLPKNFKPNTQKTKSFLKRLEYGTNVQSQKAQGYFPVTTDLGLSLGYKLHDKSSVGIGLSYKLGLESGLKDFKISHQGLGLRTYLDFKIKRGLYLAGGYEMNYRSLIQSLNELKNYSAWQNSGLIGLSKKYKINKKINGNVQLLWDFLSDGTQPGTRPIIFRIGYSLK